MSCVLHVRQQPVAVPFEQQFALSDCWLSVTNQNVRPDELSPLLTVAIKITVYNPNTRPKFMVGCLSA